MKEISKVVIKRSRGLCEVCGGQGVDLHHIVGGRGKRTQHQNEHSVILLCKECHQGTYGVHGKNGRKLDIRLKLLLQDRYKNLGYKEDEIRELMGGKLYFEEDL